MNTKSELMGSVFPTLSQAIICGGTFTTVHNTQVQNGPKSGYERLLEFVAPNALYNSGHHVDPPKCHPGTRLAIIQAIIDWVLVAGEHHETRNKDILWLTGAAGAGKSAIGKSICERCADDKRLLGSFFFGSTDETRNHHHSLVATIAYQLCAIEPQLQNSISTLIEYDPLIFTKSIRAQLLSLVIEPLSTIFSKEPEKAPLLIVIDGLDECKNPDSRRDILDTILSISVSSTIPIRFLVCSRPESQITTLFSSLEIVPRLFKIFLDDEYSPNNDIELYLRDQFRKIKESHIFNSLIPECWPTDRHIHQLVLKASGQFIYATTVIRYVDSPHHRPHHRLEAALGLRAPFKDLPFVELDILYSHILATAYDTSLALDILAFVILHSSVSIAQIETNLQLERGDVQIALSDMGSIVQVIDRGHKLNIILLHKSFEDFLFDPNRSKEFYRNREETRLRHVINAIQVFSKEHTGCKFSLKDSAGWPLNYLNAPAHRFQDLAISTQAAIHDAVASFPIKECCKSLMSHGRLCEESWFLPLFLRFVRIFNSDPVLEHLYNRHLHVWCETVLTELLTTFSDNVEAHYVFASLYIEPLYNEFSVTDNNVATMILCLKLCGIEHRAASIFQTLTDDTTQSQILARAASFCLKITCSGGLTRKESARHLSLSKGDRRRRSDFPWKWHSMADNRFRKGLLVVTGDKRGQERRLSTYKKVTDNPSNVFTLYSLSLFDWNDYTNLLINSAAQFWSTYLAFLKALLLILPRAGRYEPLIRCCKARSFSSMSMMFPSFSRRARIEINRYLARVELTRD